MELSKVIGGEVMVREKAYAKINLFLDVLGKRVDFFHELEMVMAPIELHDVLTFKKNTTNTININSNVHICDDPKDNLVYKISEYIISTYNISSGVDITIDKNIPLAAGLAGGSADAAATLRGLNKLFKLKLSLDQLAKIAEIYGADIPYCVYNKLCIARGKGEDLFFLNKKLNFPILLITPPILVSTKAVYQSVDLELIKNVRITGMTNAIYNKNYELIIHELHNALEPFTLKLFKEVQVLKDQIKAFNPDGYLMSGSGPTFFVFSKNKTLLEEMKVHFSENNRAIITKIK